jgi:hypothetical protein
LKKSTILPTTNSPSGFRALSPEEIALIAGGTNLGTITVTAPPRDYYDYIWWDYDLSGDYGGGYDGSSGGGGDPGDSENPEDPELTEEEEEKTKDVIEALKSALEENIKKYGDSIIKLPNGIEVRASDLLDALGKTLDFVEAGTLAYEAANGNMDVAATAGFLAGMLGGAAAAAAGAGPIAVFAAGVAAGMFTEYAINEAVDRFNTAWTAAYQQELQQNPGFTPGMHTLYMILQMWGIQPGPLAEAPPPPPSSPSPYNPGGDVSLEVA